MSNANNENKNYTVNDLLDEFFPSEESSGANSDPDAETDISKQKTEEISANAPDDSEVDIVTDILEEDVSEAADADITIAGESEWETEEISEILSETFDGKDISEGVSSDFCGDATASEDTGNPEANVGNEKETENKTEISRISKTETEEVAETDNENKSSPSEIAATAGTAEPEKQKQEETIDSEFNESFMIKILKGIFPWKGDSVGEVIRKIIFIIASAVFIGAGCMLLSTLIQSRQAVEQKEKDREIIVTTAATTIDESGNVVTVKPTQEEIAEHRFNVAEYYKGINEDYVGYLELSGCDIAEPIVQGEDNDYYLTHAIHGGTNKAGTVFMDYRCTFAEDYISPNIVFYGHNQEDGTMFGNLKEYKQNTEFYAENPVVRFSTENETYEYLIYGFFVTNALEKQDSNGEVFHYQDYIETLNDESTFNWYMDMVNERNQIVSPVDVEFGDKLLCLSTCSNEFSNSRFVIFARMLREDESAEDYDFSETYLNPYARGVDWEAIMSGETSAAEEAEETLPPDDDEDGLIGNGFLETAVHGTKRPAAETEKRSETTAVPEENETENTEKTTKKKKTKKTSETEETAETTQNSDSESLKLEEATRPPAGISESSADISENAESSGEGVTVTRPPRRQTETTPAETAPPAGTEDGSSETITAG